MLPIEKIRRMFPSALVEKEGDAIVVDNLLRFETGKYKRKSIRGDREWDGWVLIYLNPIITRIHERGELHSILMSAAVEYARFQASKVLSSINDDEFAEHLENERKLGFI